MAHACAAVPDNQVIVVVLKIVRSAQVYFVQYVDVEEVKGKSSDI